MPFYGLKPKNLMVLKRLKTAVLEPFNHVIVNLKALAAINTSL